MQTMTVSWQTVKATPNQVLIRVTSRPVARVLDRWVVVSVRVMPGPYERDGPLHIDRWAAPGSTRGLRRPEPVSPYAARVTPAVWRLGANRTDAVLAAAFTVLGLVQVTVAPIADPVVGQLFVLVTTAPLAWRRTRPAGSALVSTLPWSCRPTASRCSGSSSSSCSSSPSAA